MFGFGIGIAMCTLIATLEQAKQSQLEFEESCNSLSKEEADKLKSERKIELEKERQHRTNLEVAREGRSLNFWGDR